jgi:hypothetical protein
MHARSLEEFSFVLRDGDAGFFVVCPGYSVDCWHASVVVDSVVVDGLLGDR